MALIDPLAAWLLLFATMPIWLMFLLSFSLNEPIRTVLMPPCIILGGGIGLGLFVALIDGRAGAETLLLATALGLMMLTGGFLGWGARTLLDRRQFTLRTGMIVIAGFAMLFGLIRLLVP